jgi:hypothetical protein
MLHVKEGRRRYLNHVDIVRLSEPLECVRPLKEQLAIDRLSPEARVQLVEIVFPGRKLIRK